MRVGAESSGLASPLSPMDEMLDRRPSITLTMYSSLFGATDVRGWLGMQLHKGGVLRYRSSRSATAIKS
eukprot:10525857-Alexandrium_andersonii.AAC.1